METKPGVYTTEFWVTIFANILGVVNLTGVWDFTSNKYAVLFMAIISGLYTVGRGLAKSGVGADPTVAGNYKLVPKSRDMVKRG